MKTDRLILLASLLISSTSGVAATAAAQASTRAYREGPVIVVTYVRTKPGMFDKYMAYLNGAYKANLEAEKAAGIVVDYGIYSSDPRTPADHDLMLAVVYKNWGALDNLADRTDAVANRVLQSTPEQRAQQSIDRGSMRDILGNRTYQQLLLK